MVCIGNHHIGKVLMHKRFTLSIFLSLGINFDILWVRFLKFTVGSIPGIVLLVVALIFNVCTEISLPETIKVLPAWNWLVNACHLTLPGAGTTA